MGKQNMRKWAAALLSILFLFTPAIRPALAEEGSAQRRTVRVGLPEQQSADDSGRDSRKVIYDEEYLQAIAEYANWDFIYVRAAWDDCLNMLQDGAIDVLMGVAKTEERSALYDYSNEPMGTEICYLISRSDSGLSYNDYSAFDGLRVGCERGRAIADSFQEYAEQMGFEPEMKEYGSSAELYAAMEQGSVDAFIQTNYDEIPDGDVILAKCAPSPIYIITSRKTPALKGELEEAMTRLLSYNPNFNSDIYARIFRSDIAESEGYTQEELAYLSGKPTVLVPYETNWAPFEYEANGIPTGITPDVIRAVGKDTGINFQFVRSSSTQAIYNDMNGSAEDTVMAVSYDYIWANRHDLIVTQPYVSGSVMRITRRSGTEPKTVAVVEGGYLANEIAGAYPQLTPISYQTFDECMDAVADGDADCTFLNYYQASWFRQLSRYESFSYQPVDTIAQGIALGVTRESSPVLAGILSKSLQRISGKELQSILINDTAVSEPLSLRVLIKRYPIPMAFAISAFGVLISMLISLSVSAGIRKRRNLDLARAKEEAEKANEAKSVFLSNMSHDLRTPLNGILGFAAIGLEKQSAEEKQQCLQKIRMSGDLLLGLVNDTLELSRIESGKMKLDLEDFESGEIIRPILVSVQQLADAKGVHFIADIGYCSEQRIHGDRLKLQKIVLNLLSNAVKFTPAGGTVRYSVQPIDPPSGGMTCRIIVADTGIGMSPEYLLHLYEPFSQERRPETAGIQGTGLGLSIVKRMVDLMKGTIAVQSEIGRGTRFTVELPIAEAAAVPQQDSGKADADDSLLAGKRILLCEDNEMNTEIARILLEEKKMLADCAANGQEGLERLSASPVHYYDAVLMDIRMPVMDGFEAARKIRCLSREDARIPIIAMSADAFDESVRQAKAAGMNDYLTKPIDPARLYEALGKALR